MPDKGFYLILDDIILQKHIQLSNNSYLFDIVRVTETFTQVKTESFFKAISKKGLSIIGEVYKRKPNEQEASEFDPVSIALKYDWAVDALSVITEEKYFGGNPSYIKTIHEVTDTPLLLRDYVISPIQIFQAKELGASAVLLMSAITHKMELQEYIKIAYGLHMDAVVEVSDEQQLDKALYCGAKIIAINNSSLSLNDNNEDINITITLSKKIPEHILRLSYGGIYTKEDIIRLREAEINGVFVGRYFLECEDIMYEAQKYRNAYN